MRYRRDRAGQILVVLLAILVLGAVGWNALHRDGEAQAILGRMDRDVAAARDAADAAGVSAREAAEAARKAQNMLPGSS